MPKSSKVRRRFGVHRVVFVGDRGMITSRRIDEELRGVDGLDWITALRADTIRLLAEQGVIQPSLFDERDLAEVVSSDFPDERLIVCRNPLLAAERARKRTELLAATERNWMRSWWRRSGQEPIIGAREDWPASGAGSESTQSRQAFRTDDP